MFKINEFSKQTGFSSRMLRHFEELELLLPERNSKNYRYYSKQHLPVALKIKCFQKMGFSLREIKTLLLMKVSQLEENLRTLYNAKEKQLRITENQMCKISEVISAITDESADFSIINKIVEMSSADRCNILLNLDDLLTRTVKGNMPRVEIVNERMFRLLKTDKHSFEHECVNLIKYNEYFKNIPRSFFAIYEIEELISYFFVSVRELDLVNQSDSDSSDIQSLISFSDHIVKNYIQAWGTIHHELTAHFKGATDNLEQLTKIFSNNEVLLEMVFCRTDNNNNRFHFTLGLPLNVIKAVDSVTPITDQNYP